MRFELTESGKIPYGARIEQETKEEAVDRVYTELTEHGGNCFSVSTGYGWRSNLYLNEGKLVYRTALNSERVFTDAFRKHDGLCEDAEVLAIVEARVTKELLEEAAAEKARREAEMAAEQARHDAEVKAQYAEWKAEAERLGIPFADLCAMKKAESDDWDYDD